MKFLIRCQLSMFNRKAEKFIESQKLPFTAGSDAHTPGEIGNAYIEADVTEPGGIRDAIKKRKNTFSGKKAKYKVHVLTQFAKWDIISDRAE